MNDKVSENSDEFISAKSNSVSSKNEYDITINKAEDEYENTRKSRIEKNASFFALIVGILLSLINLFDIFWNKPREELFQDISEFNKSVNAVANLRQSMIQVQYQSNNPQMVFEMNSMVTPQVLANIQYATALLPRLGDHVGIPQLIVLISEAMNIYDWKSAEILVDRAIVAKDAAPTLKSEALRYKGKLMFLTGKLQEGRKAFEDSQTSIRNEPGYGINGIRANIVADWSIYEFSLGDCNIANERIRQFTELVRNPQILQPVRLGLVSSLRNQLNQLQLQDKRCSIPTELKEFGQ